MRLTIQIAVYLITAFFHIEQEIPHLPFIVGELCEGTQRREGYCDCSLHTGIVFNLHNVSLNTKHVITATFPIRGSQSIASNLITDHKKEGLQLKPPLKSLC